MGIFEAYRQRRASHSVPESVATIDHVKEYFGDGANWTQGVYRGAGDARCLVGAAEHVQISSIDDARHWFRLAIAERTGGAIATIEEFNDKNSFSEVAAVIDRARQLALAHAPAAVQIIPPAPRTAPTFNAPNPTPWAEGGVTIDAEPVLRETQPMRESQRSLRRRWEDWTD